LGSHAKKGVRSFLNRNRPSNFSMLLLVSPACERRRDCTRPVESALRRAHGLR
jgi:hypothetical protein